jgi:hypothetical protein
MTAQTRSLAALFALAILAACSPTEEPSLMSEARASTLPAIYDYGWRSPASATATADGTVHEYQ